MASLPVFVGCPVYIQVCEFSFCAKQKVLNARGNEEELFYTQVVFSVHKEGSCSATIGFYRAAMRG